MTGLEIAALAISAVGSVVSAVGQFSAAQAQARGKAYEAAVSERNAAMARSQAEVAAADQRRDTRRRLATIRAAYGSKGFSLAGSALDVLEDQAAEGELAAQRDKYEGSVAALQQQDQAKMQRLEAKSLKRSATIGLIGGGVKTAGGLYTGISGLLEG